MSKTMRFVIPTALVLAAALGAGAAQARTDVQWSVSIGLPVYAVPAPVVVQPAPVYYYEPAPVYYQPAPVYYQPAPIYYQARPVYRGKRHHGPAYWGDRDRDGDGVPNRYDRYPRDGWRR